MVEYHPISAKGQTRLNQFGEKVLPGISLRYALISGGESGKEVFWLQTVMSWETQTRQKAVLEGSMQNKYSRQRRVIFSYSQSQMEQQNCLEEIMKSENLHHGGINL